MLITILTPTYNRAALLPRLFESFIALDYTNFEWLIVDDGSTDNTADLIADFKARASFSIHYIFQENSGKHVAINKGVAMAKGELFFIVDSDDRLTCNALSAVSELYSEKKYTANFGGIAFRGCYEDGTVVGNSNFTQLVCNSIDVRTKYGVTGDLVEVFTTDVMREFPFPEINNEKFCPEVLVWNRIAKKYDLVYVNEPIYIVEYQEGGLTDRIVKIRMKSPIASMLTYSEMVAHNVSLTQKIKAGINFWRFSFNSRKPLEYKMKLIGWNYFPLAIIGWAYYAYDKLKQV